MFKLGLVALVGWAILTQMPGVSVQGLINLAHQIVNAIAQAI